MHDSIEDVLEDVRRGKPIVLVDDKDRENEGDVMVAAELVTAQTVEFMRTHCRGLICLSLSEEKRLQLGLPMQVRANTSSFGTNFTVSIDHKDAADAGMTSMHRAKTILSAARPDATADDFRSPGWIFPVCAVPGGVLKRRGQTEGSVDLSTFAGLQPLGVICEIMNSDGTMCRGEHLRLFCKEHGLRITSVEEIAQYRLHTQVALRRVAECSISEIDSALVPIPLLATKTSPLRVVVYLDDVDNKEHLAFVKGQPKNDALVRIHSECLTGDVFGSQRCDCGQQFQRALEFINSAGSGVLVYLHQEGRGIGLGNKIRAYELQEQGLDTVDANLELGFEADQRDYRVGAQILKDLGLERVQLITNNPRKVDSLKEFGIAVAKRVPLLPRVDEHNALYLKAKSERLGHVFND